MPGAAVGVDVVVATLDVVGLAGRRRPSTTSLDRIFLLRPRGDAYGAVGADVAVDGGSPDWRLLGAAVGHLGLVASDGDAVRTAGGVAALQHAQELLVAVHVVVAAGPRRPPVAEAQVGLGVALSVAIHGAWQG